MDIRVRTLHSTLSFLLNATGRIDISSPGLSSLWRRINPKDDRKPERDDHDLFWCRLFSLQSDVFFPRWHHRHCWNEILFFPSPIGINDMFSFDVVIAVESAFFSSFFPYACFSMTHSPLHVRRFPCHSFFSWWDFCFESINWHISSWAIAVSQNINTATKQHGSVRETLENTDATPQSSIR